VHALTKEKFDNMASVQVAEERAFSFLGVKERQGKPRTEGIKEIRGPYYTPMARRSLEDIVDTMGSHVDSLKFAGASFALMPRRALLEITKLCHEHDVLVSTAVAHQRCGVRSSAHSFMSEMKSHGFSTGLWLNMAKRPGVFEPGLPFAQQDHLV
jgi:phosphosulfolactate synthase (CoM biosynthesis protein A)